MPSPLAVLTRTLSASFVPLKTPKSPCACPSTSHESSEHLITKHGPACAIADAAWCFLPPA
eukprot:scaffold102010_cov18-Phaeocystis_antarctica.AAC.1